MTEIGFRELSDEQRAVVESTDQYVVVLASAGSGKTEVVAQRVERLLADSESNFRVLALSYTRRAAAELRSRFDQRMVSGRKRIETDTVHGFAQRLLLQYGTWIGLPPDPIIVTDDADRVDLFQAWRADAGLPPLEDARAKLIELDLSRARGQDHPLAEEWASALTDSGALDYESMLYRATELLELDAFGKLVGSIYRHIIVDEAQNLTQSQFNLIERLLRSSSHLCALLVGDDKQSIVSFAGASVEHLWSFETEFNAARFRLTCNFRSAEAIARLGDRIAESLGDEPSISQRYAAPGYISKEVFPDEAAEAGGVANWVIGLLEGGLPAVAVGKDESRHVVDREIAVLARSAAALRSCELALRQAGVNVSRATHADDWLMSDRARLAWLLGTFRPESAVSRRRVMRTLGISSADSNEALRTALADTEDHLLSSLVGIANPQDFIDRVSRLEVSDDDGWYQDVEEFTEAWLKFCDAQPAGERTWLQFEMFIAKWQRGDDKNQGVRLHTVHKSQGREFKAVAIVGLNDGQFPDFRARSGREKKAELRAFYVAVTRASRCLLLTRPATTHARNGAWQRTESPYMRFA